MGSWAGVSQEFWPQHSRSKESAVCQTPQLSADAFAGRVSPKGTCRNRSQPALAERLIGFHLMFALEEDHKISCVINPGFG